MGCRLALEVCVFHGKQRLMARRPCFFMTREAGASEACRLCQDTLFLAWIRWVRLGGGVQRGLQAILERIYDVRFRKLEIQSLRVFQKSYEQ